MTAVTPQHSHSRRVVWSGRFSSPLGEGLDDWNASPAYLHERLVGARELVILDPLSFPWRSMTDPERLVPLVVVLPDRLDVTTIGLLLGTPLLSRVTPFDRLIVRSEELRRALEREWPLDPAVWVVAEDVGDPWWLPPLSDYLGRSLEMVETDIGRFLCRRGDLITSHLHEHGAHQRPLLEALCSLAQPGDLVVDVGAHVGTLAVPLARHVCAEGRVLAVEAADTSHSLLVHNTSLNDLEGVLVPVRAIVGSPHRPVVGEKVPDGNTGARQLVLGDASSGEGVPALELDHLVDEHCRGRRPALVKVDVEGAELDVLEGAERIVAECRPLLCLEVGGRQMSELGRDIDQLDAWLTARDYRLFQMDGDPNGRAPSWHVTPLTSLASVGPNLADVLAVHVDSDRLPLVEKLQAP